jgi:hypothetical protein
VCLQACSPVATARAYNRFLLLSALPQKSWSMRFGFAACC